MANSKWRPMTKTTPGNTAAGFTLIELMVTLVVAGVLLAVGIPGYRSLTVGNHLSTVSNQLVSALQVARMEAIKRNGVVQFCGSTTASNGKGTLGKACNAGAGHPGGVYARGTDKDGAATVAKILEQVAVGGQSVEVKQLVGLQYSGQGFARQVGQSTLYAGAIGIVCSDDITSSNRLTISMVAGSIIDTTQTSEGCP